MTGRVQGKAVVVTGGCSGIGLASVRRFADEGAHVVIADLDDDRGQEVAAELADELVPALVVDVTDDDLGALLDEALDRRQADARAAAGDDRDPVLDASCHVCLCSSSLWVISGR